MAKPARNRAMRNLESTAQSAGNVASKAISSTFKWAATSRAMSNMPSNRGFLDTLGYIFTQLLIAVAGATLTGILAFLLIGLGIPFLISIIF